MEWGDLLRVSQRGLWTSRRFLWDKAARNIAALLACPSAWDGDHFLQVWRQDLLMNSPYIIITVGDSATWVLTSAALG